MKLVQALKSILLEKAGDSYEQGCVMLYFNFPQMKELHEEIDPEDVYNEEGDRTYGLEDETHTTLLYGLKPEVILDDVVEILDNYTFGKCIIKNVSLFKNNKYDVLKFDVHGPAIHEINEELRDKLPYENKFPDYHPHLTIGYLKAGKGKEYVEKFENQEYELMPRYAIFSQPDGKKNKIAIKVKKDKA